MHGYFIYCRKSIEAEDRQVLSIDSQVHELQEIAARLKLPVAEIFKESKSAKEPGRPVFNEMMKRLYRGEAAGVICWKLDRLARNPVDGGSVIWAIKQHGVKVITPAQSFAREDDNIILMYIEFGMAQKYVDDLSKNVKRGLKAKIEKGWFPGLAPIGYLNSKVRATGENILVRDPERFPLVRKMWDLMLTGLYTPAEILRIANGDWKFRTRQSRKTGGKAIPRAVIYRMFTQPFYYGQFEYPQRSGNFHQGKHEPMITAAEYDRVQMLLGRKGNPRPRSRREFPFVGLIRCGDCSRMVTAEEKHQIICSNCNFKFAFRNKEACARCGTAVDDMKNPTFPRYSYYHCSKSKNPSCPQKAVSVEKLEKQVDEFLGRIQISDKFKDWALKYLHELHDKEQTSRNEIIQAQQKAYTNCVRQIDNLVKLKTSSDNADGSLLSDEEYGKQRAHLLKEKSALEEMLDDVGHRVEQWLKLSEKTLEFACAVRERFAKGDAKTKKEILSTVGSNLILKDKILSVEAKKPFFFIENSHQGEKSEIAEIEQENIYAAPISNELVADPSLGLCGKRDDVRTLYHKNRKLVRSIYRFFQSFKGVPSDIFPGWLADEESIGYSRN